MKLESLIRSAALAVVLLAGCAPPAMSPAAPAPASTLGAAEPSPEAKTLRAQLTAVIRAPSFLDTLPAAERAQVISEPFEPGMVLVYMVDQHGAARVAREQDLVGSGVSRDALRAVVQWNLGLALAPKCEPGTITRLAPASYYQSSRLLLDKQWADLAASSGHIVVAAPRNDTLFIACNPTPANIEQLATDIRNLWPRADHPVSSALLSWTGSGWEELKPPI